MIEKLYESYDDNNYYIENNKKKLAHDNAAVVSGVLAFLVVISVGFVATLLLLGDNIAQNSKYLPAVLIVIAMLVIDHFFNPGEKENYEASRVYALVFYGILIIAFSTADILAHPDSRAVFFPVALVLMSVLYMDRMLYILLFKIVLAAIILVIDFNVKSSQIFASDVTVAILAIIVSMFAYITLIGSTLSRREDNQELVSKSQTDLLTGLLNKISFEERCTEYLEKRVIGARATMFIFDLDDFKSVNDNYGHQIGDKTLQYFAEILKGYFHPDDVIGRVGGDEFMVLVLGEMPEGFAERRCRSVLHELKTTDIEGNKGQTCSIGIVEDTQGHNFMDLYKMADAALYKSKESGKDTFHLEKTS